jgi:hypothetical protein
MKNKPKMTRKDASFHIATAGVRAQKQADERGLPAEAVDALLDTGPLQIAGLTLKPLSLPVTWALEAVGSIFVNDGSAVQVQTRDIAVAILCFTDPVGARLLAKKDDRDGIEDRAMDICEKVGFAEMGVINAWMAAQFARVAAITGGEEQPAPEPTEKKPDAPPGAA